MNPEYKERRRLILAKLQKALEEDDIDDYAAAYDTLQDLEREAAEFDAERCRLCGAEDDDVDREWAERDLCKECSQFLAHADRIANR